MTELIHAFDALKQLEFPAHPESDALHDWILELAELDGYIAGLASSIISGAHPHKYCVHEINTFMAALDKIPTPPGPDQLIHAHCQRYRSILEAVHQALLDMGCRRVKRDEPPKTQRGEPATQ